MDVEHIDDTNDNIGPKEEDDNKTHRALLSIQEKLHNCASRGSSFIVKLYRRNLECKYFYWRIHVVWRPTRGLSLVDVAKRFIIAIFHNVEVRARISYGSSTKWFLIIKRWEPKLNLDKAPMPLVALWVCFSQLHT